MNTQSLKQTLYTPWRIVLALIIGLGFSLSPTIARAATCTWTGAADTDWDNPANWTGCGGAIPGATDDVVIPTGITPEPTLNTYDITIASLTIQAGRVLTIGYTLTLTGDLHNDGALSISGSTAATLEFGGSGTQSISGNGTFTGIGKMIIQTGRNVSLSNPITLTIDLLTNYGTLALDSHTLTISDTTLDNGGFYGPGTVSGTGTFQTQGESEIDNNDYYDSSFEVALRVLGGATTASGTLDGTILVDSGATLEVGTFELNANNDVNIDGTLSGSYTYSDFRFNGQTFINNGTVDVAEFTSLGASSVLTGTSSVMNGTDLGVEAGMLTLGSNLAVNSVEIKAHATLDITDHTLTLLGSGFSSPLYIYSDGVFVTSGSTVVYGGNVEQEIAGTDYYNLSSTGSGARTLDYSTIQIAGAFSPGSNNYTVAYSTIAYNGAVPQTLPAGFSTYANLIIANPNGVTLSGDVTVNDALTLDADLFTESYTLIFEDAYTRVEGDYEVVGTVRRTEFSIYSTEDFNHQHTTLTFYGGTLPGEAAVTLVREAPTGPGLLPSVARVYTIAQTGGSGFSTDIRLHYLDSELGGIREGDLQLWRWDGSKWVPQGRSNINTSQNWVELDDVSQPAGKWAIALKFSAFLPLIQK